MHPTFRVLHDHQIFRDSITRILLGEVPHYAIFCLLSLPPFEVKISSAAPYSRTRTKTIRLKEIRSTDSIKFIVMYYFLQYNGKHYTLTLSHIRATMFLH